LHGRHSHGRERGRALVARLRRDIGKLEELAPPTPRAAM
jgi:hypothetical protein